MNFSGGDGTVRLRFVPRIFLVPRGLWQLTSIHNGTRANKLGCKCDQPPVIALGMANKSEIKAVVVGSIVTSLEVSEPLGRRLFHLNLGIRNAPEVSDVNE